MTNIQKCGVIGVGFVGATCAYTLAVSGVFSDLVLVDMNRDKAIGEAADINHGVAFSKPCRVMAGDYADLAECGLIIIAAGANQKPGESRLELLGRNKGILSSVIAQLTAVNREAILLVVSNPVDVLTCLAQQLSGFPAGRVLGSGTVLDTARLKYLLGQRLGVDSRNVHAFIIGEHGDSEIAAWSLANISGIPLNDFCELRGHTDHQRNMDRIAEGVTLEDGEIFADEISYVKENKQEVGIEIHSGRNRIVRRIFEFLGYTVTKLDRVYYAGLTKKNLKRGAWRFLTREEVERLKSGQYE